MLAELGTYSNTLMALLLQKMIQVLHILLLFWLSLRLKHSIVPLGAFNMLNFGKCKMKAYYLCETLRYGEMEDGWDWPAQLQCDQKSLIRTELIEYQFTVGGMISIGMISISNSLISCTTNNLLLFLRLSKEQICKIIIFRRLWKWRNISYYTRNTCL